MSKFYYINNTCDHDINIAGEILVVLDEQKNVIWHHDWSDSVFDFSDHLPRDLMKNFGATYDSEFVSLNEADIKLLKGKLETYLDSHGYGL